MDKPRSAQPSPLVVDGSGVSASKTLEKTLLHCQLPSILLQSVAAFMIVALSCGCSGYIPGAHL